MCVAVRSSSFHARRPTNLPSRLRTPAGRPVQGSRDVGATRGTARCESVESILLASVPEKFVLFVLRESDHSSIVSTHRMMNWCFSPCFSHPRKKTTARERYSTPGQRATHDYVARVAPRDARSPRTSKPTRVTHPLGFQLPFAHRCRIACTDASATTTSRTEQHERSKNRRQQFVRVSHGISHSLAGSACPSFFYPVAASPRPSQLVPSM